MSLLGRKKGVDEATAAAEAEPVDTDVTSSRKITAPKGRPTPKRGGTKRRGPIAPAPTTAAEARRRRKAMGRPKLTRGERKVEKAERRQQVADRRERMMAGEEGYLLPRDRGPVRQYVRDVVDARRNVLGLFMPAALALIFVMLSVPQVQFYISPAMLVLVAIMVIDGLFLARKVTNLVDVKFPGNGEGRWKLGFYAASRASQLRRMRAPRPRVNRGDGVT
ncbi:MAG: hypothetical protein QOE41_4239 [Mycobacterium sp.]|nr:conserved transrane protein [Mycobacterium sp.]MDT5134928.1 hypothetical protein [Mycobacterium sp.]